MTANKSTISSLNIWQTLCDILVISTLVIAFSSTGIVDALATDLSTKNDALETMICNAINYVTGTTGKGVASIVLIVTGISFFSGNISWTSMLGIMAGIGIIFGAPTILKKVTGSKGDFCATSIVNVTSVTGGTD